MTGSALFDPGLQPERTGLAWRRTLLTLAVAALISLRLLPPVLGAWSLGVGVAGLLMTGVFWMLANRRASRLQSALRESGEPTPGGTLLLALALAVAASGALGLLVVTLIRSAP